MFKWYDLLSLKTVDQVNSLKASVKDGANPRDIKVELAMELTERFSNQESALKAKDNFFKKFSTNELPSDIEEKIIEAKETYAFANLLKDIGFAVSTSEAIRLINQGAVKVDQEKVVSKDYTLEPNAKKLIQVGKKKFVYLTIKQG
jgi:tyrosyl-tRNA synthetase